jgi:hypothetical protein
MQVKLREGQIDVCIGPSIFCPALNADKVSALTDALIAGIANGQNAYKLVGRYISSPLRWSASERYVPCTETWCAGRSSQARTASTSRLPI